MFQSSTNQNRGSQDIQPKQGHQSEQPTLYHTVTLPTAQELDQRNVDRRSSQSVVASGASIPSIHRSISETIGHDRNGEDSPVMNETLTVIDEHITDMSTPRHSLAAPEVRIRNDSASEYSSHLESQNSYSHGGGTDEASDDRLREADVRRWNSRETAEHLRLLSVDQKHCDIFEEQEITGDVILDMDQHFIYMKEYDFGPMGRRLKTWHKIRDFQDEVKGAHFRGQDALAPSQGDSMEELARSRSRPDDSQNAPVLPRTPLMEDTPALVTRHSRQVSDGDAYPTPLQTQTSSPRMTDTAPSSWRASVAPDSPERPSAASIRQMSHSRRHSSMDSGSLGGFDPPGTTIGSMTSTHHRKQSSLDRSWTMNMLTPRIDEGATAACKHVKTHELKVMLTIVATPTRLSTIRQELQDSPTSPIGQIDPSSVDLDRGYFSGGELDNRKSRNLLRKRDSTVDPAQPRLSSMMNIERPAMSAIKRHSRLGSADSIRDSVPAVTSPAAKAYHSNTFKGRLRSASARGSIRNSSVGGMSPTVTNLEEDAAMLQSSITASSQKANGFPSIPPPNVPKKARKLMGLRAVSDAVTGDEKALAVSPAISSPIKENEVASPARTGSSTPSIASKSFEIDNTDTSSKGTDGPISLTQSRSTIRMKTKSKRQTSAFTRGLQKKTPAEQRIGCDHSGWMRKKSSSIVTTWKPRLFILHGRRLSYYYSEDEKEERGVIDISNHKVLVANSDAITTFHASITGSTSSPTPSSTGEKPAPVNWTSSGRSPASAPFFFKLVPPKSGLSRAVQFTKPAVHYFQAENIVEGRRWMGAIMKATIEHTAMNFETTNKQKTISLAKARARKERPPALQEAEESELPWPASGRVSKDAPQLDEVGLNIRGLGFEEGRDGAAELEGEKDVGLDTGQAAERA